MIEFNLNTSLKYHLLIAISIGVWIFLFIVLIGPFDASSVPIERRTEVMFGYGIVFIICYSLAIPVQNYVVQKQHKWTIYNEAFIIILIFTFSFFGSFWYYKSGIIQGGYSLIDFFWKNYIPTIIILIPICIIARYLVNKKIKSTDNKLSTDQMRKWQNEVQKIMNEKIYLRKDFNLKDFSEILNTNSALASKFINQTYNANFNDFINSYRIKEVEACFKLGNHKTHTLQAIAEECGFSSKTTFYRAFKKIHKKAPSQFLKEYH